jgi:hypothetical protein
VSYEQILKCPSKPGVIEFVENELPYTTDGIANWSSHFRELKNIYLQLKI